MSWFTENLVESLLIIGLVLIGIEVLVLGFSTFVIFFVGLAALVSAGLIFIGVIPASVLSAVLSVGVISGLAAVFLWKPLKRMQSSVEKEQVQNDFIGLRFTLEQDLTTSSKVTYRYSGIDWQLQSDEDIKAGTQVEVINTEVGTFKVVPAD